MPHAHTHNCVYNIDVHSAWLGEGGKAFHRTPKCQQRVSSTAWLARGAQGEGLLFNDAALLRTPRAASQLNIPSFLHPFTKYSPRTYVAPAYIDIDL